jgi:hypothetical protein
MTDAVQGSQAVKMERQVKKAMKELRGRILEISRGRPQV